MRTMRQPATNVATQTFDFGCNDKRGRAMGAEITTYEVDFVEIVENCNGGFYTHVPGHYFAFNPHTTRNGNGYGPVQPDYYFTTVAERQSAIDKYLTNSKKRALKL